MFFDWRIGGRLAGFLGIGGVTNGAVNDPILPGTLPVATTLMADRGDYLLTGNSDTLLEYHRIFHVSNGTYTYTGNAENFHKGYYLFLSEGSYIQTGKPVNELEHHYLRSGIGTYTYTGNNTTLLEHHKVFITPPGSYTYTGNPIAFEEHRRLQIGTGSYVLVGRATEEILTVNIVGGSYTQAGNNVNLLYNRDLLSDQGSYTYTGNNVGFIAQISLFAGIGSYTYTGNDTLKQQTRIAGQGAYTYTGMDADLTNQPRLYPKPGHYTCTLNRLTPRATIVMEIDLVAYYSAA